MTRAVVPPVTVPDGQTFVHPYGSRTIHLVPMKRAVRGDLTACGNVKVDALADLKSEGDYVPNRWARWRLCGGCFA